MTGTYATQEYDAVTSIQGGPVLSQGARRGCRCKLLVLSPGGEMRWPNTEPLNIASWGTGARVTTEKVPAQGLGGLNKAQWEISASVSSLRVKRNTGWSGQNTVGDLSISSQSPCEEEHWLIWTKHVKERRAFAWRITRTLKEGAVFCTERFTLIHF